MFTSSVESFLLEKKRKFFGNNYQYELYLIPNCLLLLPRHYETQVSTFDGHLGSEIFEGFLG